MLLCLLTLVSILPYLLQLAPFVNLAVDTFPDKRGQLSNRILLFFRQEGTAYDCSSFLL